MSKSLLALTALASIGLSAPALGEPVSKAIRTQDLNLATPDGRAHLQRRLTYAARAVCHSGSLDAASLLREQRCFEIAMKSAQVQVAVLVEKAIRAKS